MFVASVIVIMRLTGRWPLKTGPKPLTNNSHG